jgi:IS30 family transposase
MKNTKSGFYNHLNLDERIKIFTLKREGVNLRDIAREINRDVGTISRELRRNKSRCDMEYFPTKAEENSVKKSIRQRTKAPLKNFETYLYVREKLREEKWSPEEISGRIKIDKPHLSICPETIYRYIYEKGKIHKLWGCLTERHNHRKKKKGRGVWKCKSLSKIPNAISILERPKSILKRKTEGHLETDLMEGVRREKEVVTVEVFRKSRYLQLTKIPNKKAKTKKKILIKKLKVIQSLQKSTCPIVKSITGDNGSENTDHVKISSTLGAKFWFCQPYHSWEKGTVENTIKRMRRFVPKGTPLSTVSEIQIAWLENKMNNTPRKCLGFLTPNEVFEKEVNSYKFRKFKKLKEQSVALQLRM